jgi:hypothetical protein
MGQGEAAPGGSGVDQAGSEVESGVIFQTVEKLDQYLRLAGYAVI